MGNNPKTAKKETPLLKKWVICFSRKDASEVHDQIVRTFASFFQTNLTGVTMRLPGDCRLEGEAFGFKDVADGDKLVSPRVTSLKRLNHANCGAMHDLVCATTESGSKIYFYLDEYGSYTALMLSDIMYTGRLRHKRYHK